jgi:membrane protein YdbS with pleckstrin-like domain
MLLENLQLEKSELPLLENVDYSPHPKDYRDMRLLILMIVMFLLSGFWIMQLVFLNMTAMGVIFLIWTGLLSIILLEEIKGFKKRGYALRQRDITYKKGFLIHSQTTIPFNRVQHCETTQGPLSRAFGLMSLKVFTAGGASSDLRISGLRPEEANRLKDFITEASSTYE